MKLSAARLAIAAAALCACAVATVPTDARVDARSDAATGHDASPIDTVTNDSAVDTIAPPIDTPVAMDAPRSDAPCVPRGCGAGECGSIDNGCGTTVACSTTCSDPEVCGTDHRCARPAPLPYPTRSAYRIKSLQPDFWPNADEIAGNNTGGVAMNLVWALWEPSRRAPPCGADIEMDGHCFTVDANVDNAIRDWSARGLVVTAVVYGTPAWARTGRTCTPAGPGFEWFCAPNDPNDYGRFVRAIARRYDGHHGNGRIADFVIQNEVNANDWFDIGCGQGAGACDVNAWVSQYAAVYNAAYDAVALEQPTARVLFSFEHHFGTAFDAPAASSPLLSVQTFRTRLAPMVAPRAWHVAYHPYPPDLLRPNFSPDDAPRVTYGNLGTLLGWLRQTFPGVPSALEVELTESGVNSIAPNSSGAAQATAVCDSFRNVLGTPGIDNYVYHRMVDHPVEVASGLGLGLRNADGSAKPAWAVWALANRNDTMPPMLSCGFEDVPYTRVRRSYNASRGHWASSRVAPAGFASERSWRLWRDAQPGTVMLYECRVGTHNMLTRDPGCEGQSTLGPVGHAYTDPVAGALPIYRCRVGAGTDHFVSPDPGCEGQTMESLLGYGLP